MCNVNYKYTKCVIEVDMTKIKERLKRLRKENGVSQKEVADYIGVSVSAYSNYEQGIREPSLDVLLKLSDFFDTTCDYLLGKEKY